MKIILHREIMQRKTKIDLTLAFLFTPLLSSQGFKHIYKYFQTG